MLAGDVYLQRSILQEVKFPGDFVGLLFEIAEVLGLERGEVHQDAVRDAAVCHGFPGIGNLCGEGDLAVDCFEGVVFGDDPDLS